MSIAEVYELPAGRVVFSDDQGRVLRATWHLDRGFVNLSVWSYDRCTETFRLSLSDTAQLVAFLVDGLSDATSRLLHAVNSSTSTSASTATSDQHGSVATRVQSSRVRLAAWIAPKTQRR
jgi:hypothetical protein